ncbi:hypothetical protein [Varunaivibrio sulfuroxidans]|uniref:SacI restriction endonuclease n=1 Tax=Varunaivibrio sulfuroxidans TaxID=1773489 RepID=A0A4V2UND1_9PROT|nr:hypothetical protein [Varunaivibrio sulfuroxidans]TCS61601.1 hypothetical protein EDD55_1077 [Varunaivibrio sulfuroxidans]WES29524.1 hypothetical protein P3M64_07585 [Varunaivibrio sulfuroxidans]
MSTDVRNKKAQEFIERKLEHVASLSEADFSALTDYEQLKTTLQNLIFTKAMGFRGVVATAITGQFIDAQYDPLNRFYDCNPRAIFEQGIFYAYQGRIPCGKSDPLNVAKNTNVLDENWAQGKRPQVAAQAAVDYLRYIQSAPAEERESLVDFFFFKLVEYAATVAAIAVCAPDERGLSNQKFAHKCSTFLLEYPESGTVPQFVVSRLLQKLYDGSCNKIEGGDESVFGTNTTSKKPADIWLELDGNPVNLFEITVKKIDKKRLDDCIEALDSLSLLDRPVQFICRIPEDIQELDGVQNNALNFKGKTINFVDIRQFIYSISSLLTASQIEEILLELRGFIEDIGRPIKTKTGWNEIFKTE